MIVFSLNEILSSQFNLHKATFCYRSKILTDRLDSRNSLTEENLQAYLFFSFINKKGFINLYSLYLKRYSVTNYKHFNDYSSTISISCWSKSLLLESDDYFLFFSLLFEFIFFLYQVYVIFPCYATIELKYSSFFLLSIFFLILQIKKNKHQY